MVTAIQNTQEYEDFRNKHRRLAEFVFMTLYRSANGVERRLTDYSLESLCVQIREFLSDPLARDITLNDAMLLLKALPTKELVMAPAGESFSAKLELWDTGNSNFKHALEEATEDLISTVWLRNESRVIALTRRETKIAEMSALVHTRADAIENILSEDTGGFTPAQDAQFMVARQWNSWTPSFFDLAGGCYALAAPECSNPDEKHVVIFDPGFKALSVIREEFAIDVSIIDTLVVSHFHPDHVGGLFETLSLRHTLSKKHNSNTRLLLNTTSFEVFGHMGGPFASEKIIPDKQVLLYNIERWDGCRETAYLKAFPTDHYEAGQSRDSLGLTISVSTDLQAGGGHQGPKRIRTVTILGDTAYSSDFAGSLVSSDVIILHLGSFVLKDASSMVGKHLYADGILKILEDCGAQMRKRDHQSADEYKKLVLVSELGLEHAPPQVLKRVLKQGGHKLDRILVAQGNGLLQDIEGILQDVCWHWGEIFIANSGSQVTLGHTIEKVIR